MQTIRLIEDERLAVYHLSYRKVQIKNINPNKPMGPSLGGQWYWPVEVRYFDDHHEIGFTATPPEDYNGRL